jgi:hypothetical protein
VKQQTKLSLAITLFVVAFILVIAAQAQTSAPNNSPSASPTDVVTQTPSPSSSPSPTKTTTPKPVVLNYWPDGLVADDVSNTLANDKSCSFDMCVFVKITAVRNCSSITLDGDIYDINDELFDSFSTDYKGLKKGQSRIVELGEDALDDSEDYIELADATCYK